MNQKIADRVSNALPGCEVEVAVEGNRALIEVVSHAFAGLSRVQRHQAVYRCVEDLIADGALHAVTIRTNVPPQRS